MSPHASPVRPAAVRATGWGWRHADRTEPAVTGLDLAIEPGERVLLLGPSGGGKSTLLHAMAGVLGAEDDADEFGTLTIDGVAARQARGRAGLMQQDPETQVVLSRVGDDVAFGAENLCVPPSEIWERVAESLDAVGLRLPLDHPTSALSGGQKQRLALAGILAMQPGLILLDEPTANLDPDGVLEVRDAVARALAATGATLVVVEHRVAVWTPLVDRVVVLAPRRAGVSTGASHAILADGAPEQVLSAARQELIAAGIWVPGFIPPVGRAQAGSRGPQAGPGGARAGTSTTAAGTTATAGQALLSAHALGVSRARFGRRRRPVPAVSGVDLEIRAGAALNITGPNGSGKSALALTLAGLLPPVEGRVTAADILHRGAGANPNRWRAGDLVSRVGTVFQEPEHQFVTSRVYDELAFGPRHSARAGSTGRGGRGSEAKIDARVRELLDRLRLDGLADANPFTLSGGEKRRLSVATVLAANPDVLILDEPTFGQDARTWAELASLLLELMDSGTAVVSVTHDAEFVDVLGGASYRLGAQTGVLR